MPKHKIVHLTNPLSDPAVAELAYGLSGQYIDLADVVQTLMQGIAYNILEEPDDEFPFDPYTHYDTMLRDLLGAILYACVDDVDEEVDRIIDDYADDFCEMHRRVYRKLSRGVSRLTESVSEETHIFNITSITGGSLQELNSESDDLIILFLPRVTSTMRIHHGSRNHHSQYH